MLPCPLRLALSLSLRTARFGSRKILGRLFQFGSNLVDLLPIFAASLAFGASIVFVLLPRRTLYLMLFVVALVAAVYVINPTMSIYSNHGMAHLGFVYASQRFHWPPEDPYFAGTSLHYPWGFDALVGGISSLLSVSPTWAYIGCNLAALAVSVIAVAKISRLLEGDLVTANCAVVIGLLAPTLLGDGAEGVFWPLSPLHDAALWGSEALPAVEKYMNVNAMPLGMAVGLVGLYKMLSIIKAEKWTALDLLSVA